MKIGYFESKNFLLKVETILKITTNSIKKSHGIYRQEFKPFW